MIPFGAVVPIEPVSGFVLYDQDLVGIDHAGGDLEITDPDQTARYSRWLDLLLAVAVTGEDAADMCRRVAGELSDDGTDVPHS